MMVARIKQWIVSIDAWLRMLGGDWYDWDKHPRVREVHREIELMVNGEKYVEEVERNYRERGKYDK